ncbi:MAG TPA: acyl-CoA dehydrogenase family protein [Bryobacteraceae bacterium]|jgi:alkylation response protein AidB-like acyl-CoA dehydrogenase|nr:acyl-CoA dehydrogenase family protein [Bryobacteraceae bacterium]
MQFGLSESQRILKDNARKFFATECPMSEVRRIAQTETAHDESLWRKMAAQGFQGVVIAEEAGGLGLGHVELAALAEEMGRALAPGGFLSTITAAAAIAAAGSGRYLSGIAAGTVRGTVAFLESTASWDPEDVKMSGLTGEKRFVADAATADFLLVAARDGGELALYLVQPDQLRITAMPAIDLTRRLYKVRFENARGDLLARGVAARQALERAFDVATVALCAEMTGGMQRMLDIAVEYAKTRKQFGKPIGQYQAVQHACADMLLWTESSRSAAYYAAWALDSGSPSEARTAVSIAKSYASDACREVGNRAVQIQGGMGFTWENDTHFYYRRAKASEIAFGDAAYHRERIARIVLNERRAGATVA